MLKNLFCSAMLIAVFYTGSAYASYLSDTVSNNDFATAISLDPYFTKNFDNNINDGFNNNISLTHLHASATGTANTVAGNFDYFSFNISQAGVTGFFDIDDGMPDLDSTLALFDANHNSIAFNDDGFILDAGSVHGFDSFMSYTFNNPGLYFIAVGESPVFPLQTGQTYTLHASLTAVPLPATAWLFGSALAGLIGVARRKIFPA